MPTVMAGHIGRELVAVGPGLVGSLHVGDGFAMNPLPIQPAKIHCPPQRDDTLSRERLNSWLDRATAGRIALIVAEAGFGKTTLLADWARHTARQTAWYRLEADDRDWLTFIRHLVASVRELDPTFAPETYAMLVALGSGGQTARDLTTSIAREIAAFGTASGRGLTLILDDFHLVDGDAETEQVVRALAERTGQGFSIVLASRSMPMLPIGRIRAGGGVLTLHGRDLCFDEIETSILFRDGYHQPLEADVVTDLHARTEGWIALLMLVNARLSERRDQREFVSQLVASRGDIYDFLAEEVLSSLPEHLGRFLRSVSVLTGVDASSAAAAAETSIEAASEAIREAERLGLLTRPDRDVAHRFHPLIREYLAASLLAQVGAEAVAELHRRVAAALPAGVWHLRAWHLRQAGDQDACESVVDGALELILASGDFELARPFLDPTGGDPTRSSALVLRSRLESARGDVGLGVEWARAAVAASAGTDTEGLCLLNLASALSSAGIADEAASMISDALALDLSPRQRHVALANLAILQASLEGDLQATAQTLGNLAAEQERDGHRRYAGISRLNLAGVLLWVGDADEALKQGEAAERLLGGRGTGSFEQLAATAIVAAAKAQLGLLDPARALVGECIGSASSVALAEVALEAARIEIEFGSAALAKQALDRVNPSQFLGSHEGLYHLMLGELSLRKGDLPGAATALKALRRHRCADAAGHLRTNLLRARVALGQKRLGEGSKSGVQSAADEALRVATVQNTRRGRYLARLLRELASDRTPDALILQAERAEEYCWSLLAEELATTLHTLSHEALTRLEVEMRTRPQRWSGALRDPIRSGHPAGTACARLLAAIGSSEDADWLRSLAASRRGVREAALVISTRLAAPALIRDLGVVGLWVGTDSGPRALRRKVLALLCYLSIRPRMAASREEAIEALWPDLDPQAGGNSMHQAIYSLRRVFEPGYREGLTANYIQFDGDVVSLSMDLIDTTSRACWREIGVARSGETSAIDRLVDVYTSRYALTFAYEDWAEAYRENLHAAVLASIESDLRRSRQVGNFERAIHIGQALLAVDPEADSIELELLRAYKQSGRHAAAAEQYAHYAALVREELAADPLPFEEI